jgi:hypothetical protein
VPGGEGNGEAEAWVRGRERRRKVRGFFEEGIVDALPCLDWKGVLVEIRGLVSYRV